MNKSSKIIAMPNNVLDKKVKTQQQQNKKQA